MARAPKAKSSQLTELERQIQAKSEEYLACRELRHHWDGYTAHYSAADRSVIQRTLKCVRCAAEKDQEISSRSGMILWTGAVRYPEGYLFVGVGRMTTEAMGAVRLASVTNQLFQAVVPKEIEQ